MPWKVSGKALFGEWARSYDKIPSGTVALAAWGALDTMQEVDKDRIETFFDTYSGALGPERITC